MRRLDELLTAASDRGERTGAAALIEHLERRLQGEREQVVAAPRRSTMVATETRPQTPTEYPPRRRKRWAYALAAFALVAGTVAATVALLGDGSGEEIADPAPVLTPTEVMQRLATALESVDSQIEEPIAAETDDAAETGFLAWNAALGLDPVFSGCEETFASASSSTFRCDVMMGEGYFFSAVAGENLSTTMTASVTMDGSLAVRAWPPPQELVPIEIEFRDWILATHPELEGRMFGTDFGGVVKFSREAGELHTQHLDEYLAYLAAD